MPLQCFHFARFNLYVSYRIEIYCPCHLMAYHGFGTRTRRVIILKAVTSSPSHTRPHTKAWQHNNQILLFCEHTHYGFFAIFLHFDDRQTDTHREKKENAILICAFFYMFTRLETKKINRTMDSIHFVHMSKDSFLIFFHMQWHIIML